MLINPCDIWIDVYSYTGGAGWGPLLSMQTFPYFSLSSVNCYNCIPQKTQSNFTSSSRMSFSLSTWSCNCGCQETIVVHQLWKISLLSVFTPFLSEEHWMSCSIRCFSRVVAAGFFWGLTLLAAKIFWETETILFEYRNSHEARF